METALVVALCLWALFFFERERRDPGRWPLSAVCLGFLMLARPEGLLLAVLALWLLIVGGGARRSWRVLVHAGIMVVIVVPWLFYAGRSMGTMLPVTGAAKGTVGLAAGWDPLLDVARILVTTSGLEMLLIAVGLTAMRPGEGVRAWLRGPHALPVAWLIVLPLFYAATGFDVLSRYALPILPLVVLYGFLALGRMTGERGFRLTLALLLSATVAFLGTITLRAPVAVVGVVAGVAFVLGWAMSVRLHARRHVVAAILVVAWNAGVLGFVVYPHTHAFGSGVTRCFRGLGEWFAEHTPADAEVAIADIGAFGYYSNRRILDMAALVSPELLPLVDRYSIQEIAARLAFADVARPDYLIDRFVEPHRLDGTLGGTFEPLPVDACAIEGLGVRSPETIYYTAYRVHWDRYQAWSAAEVPDE